MVLKYVKKIRCTADKNADFNGKCKQLFIKPSSTIACQYNRTNIGYSRFDNKPGGGGVNYSISFFSDFWSVYPFLFGRSYKLDWDDPFASVFSLPVFLFLVFVFMFTARFPKVSVRAGIPPRPVQVLSGGGELPYRQDQWLPPKPGLGYRPPYGQDQDLIRYVQVGTPVTVTQEDFLASNSKHTYRLYSFFVSRFRPTSPQFTSYRSWDGHHRRPRRGTSGETPSSSSHVLLY